MTSLQYKYCYSGNHQQMGYITTIYRSTTESHSVFDEQMLQSKSQMWKVKTTCSGDTQNCFNTPLSPFGTPSDTVIFPDMSPAENLPASSSQISIPM